MNHVTVAYNRSTDEKSKQPGIAFYGVEMGEPSVAICNSLIALNGSKQEPDVNRVHNIKKDTIFQVFIQEPLTLSK